jgi:hypothetical protein
MSDIDNVINLNNTPQPVVKKIDMTLKLAVLVGILLLLFLFWFFPSLVNYSLYAGAIICLGLFLPRQAGWNKRERRAKKSKQDEQKKWGFSSRDREGPWINNIDYPLVRITPLTNNKYFYSDWLVIEDNKIIVNPGTSEVDLAKKTVSYDLTQPNAYAWDGCSPKRLFFWVALIGTPDWWHSEQNIKAISEQGELVDKKVFWQLCMHASLIHDALYQYLDNIPLSKIEVDHLFYQMLLEAGMPELLAKIYHFSVHKFGAKNVLSDNAQVSTDMYCETFKQLITV